MLLVTFLTSKMDFMKIGHDWAFLNHNFNRVENFGLQPIRVVTLLFSTRLRFLDLNPKGCNQFIQPEITPARLKSTTLVPNHVPFSWNSFCISSVYGFFNNMIKYVILLILMLKQHHIYFFIYNVSYMINYELELVSKLVN